ncbi:MAG: aspartate aminotransferase family protein [Thermomicrobiales bacterium]|nr:aspartate aminotransferase family protein [Thermomicrobiales bacterium]
MPDLGSPLSRFTLPREGIPADQIRDLMDDASTGDVEWELGRVAALVYMAGEDVTQVSKEAYLTGFSTNGLAPTAFPSLRKYESDVIDMVSGMLNAQHAVGAITSGGTESILLAVLIARERARKRSPHITSPTMVLPETAHPAFNKAGYYFDIEPIRVPTGAGYRVDVDRYEAAITDDTILCVGSAPNYVYTMIDPIPKLSELARARDISFHVDACVGGFFLPFVEKLGYSRIPFDFRNPGVTTISADLHKFGYTAKGASTLTCRDDEIGSYMGFHFADWPGGSYRTPTLTGTRPGGAIAAAWAVMNYLGEDGYLDRTKQTMDFVEHLLEEIESIPDLYVVGEPDMSLVAYGSHTLDMVAIGDAMQDRGWFVYMERIPPSIHLMLSPGHAPFIELYLSDLNEVVELARAGKIERKRDEIKYGQ